MSSSLSPMEDSSVINAHNLFAPFPVLAGGNLVKDGHIIHHHLAELAVHLDLVEHENFFIMHAGKDFFY